MRDTIRRVTINSSFVCEPYSLFSDPNRQAVSQGHSFYTHNKIPLSPPLRTRSPQYDWLPSWSGSPATQREESAGSSTWSGSIATPGTTGSADPIQSDQEEDPRASTPPINPTIGTSRWASFQFPPDIFTNPPDPIRHELYHRIRLEDWFINQTQERSITDAEASRVPGASAGDSILLAFLDKKMDEKGKMAMRCMICIQTTQESKLYYRPDRAEVHIRHHFELRPIPCNGNCNIPQW